MFHQDNEYLIDEVAVLSTMLRDPCSVSDELSILADTLQEQHEMSTQLNTLADTLEEQQELAEEIDSFVWEIQKQSEMIKETKRQLESFQRRGGGFKQLEKAKATCTRLRVKWINTKVNSERLLAEQEQKVENETRISDELVTNSLRDLIYAIRRLAAKASADERDYISPTPEQCEAFGGLVPQFEKYFTAHTWVLFEAIIWAKLCRFIVPQTTTWSNRGVEPMNSIFQKLDCKYSGDYLAT